MTCVRDSSLQIFEGFPGTFLEWHVRQSRWDKGDLILVKYLFAWSYGLAPNVLSLFSNSKCIPFYRSFASRTTVHTGTFSSRVITIRPLIVAAALVYTRLGGNTMFLVVWAIYNIEILLIPFLAKLATSASFFEVLLLTVHDVYMGAIDIYYGSARTVRALISIACGAGGWVPSGDMGNTPLQAMLQFCRCALIEVVTALCAELWFIRKSIYDGEEFREMYLTVIMWLGLVICHPVYVFVTSHKIAERRC